MQYVILSAITAALSGILFGYDTGVISGAILFITKQFHLSSIDNGLVVSAVLIGACIGALFSGRMTDYYGRKKMLVVDSVLFIIGTIIAAMANTIIILIIGRIVVGIAIGIASFTAPLYISEIAPKTYRGALVSLNQLAVSAGICISYLVDYHFSHSGQWRFMFLVGVIPALILMIGLFFLPESPRWIIKKGHSKKALSILEKLRGNMTQAKAECDEITSNHQKNQCGWKMLFHRHIRKTLWIGCGLSVIQQVTGINTMLYYAPTIFQTSGFNEASGAILASMSIGIVFFIFTLVGLLLIDKWGRKPLLYSGVILMAFALTMIVIAFHFNSALLSTKILLMLGTLIYVMAFAMSLGPIPWLMIAEIFPLSIRGLGASIATFFNWASNGLVAISFLSCIDYFGKANTFSLYLVSCILSLVFIYYCVPETKHVSLEALERNLIHEVENVF